jgi:hypothetical protein
VRVCFEIAQCRVQDDLDLMHHYVLLWEEFSVMLMADKWSLPV